MGWFSSLRGPCWPQFRVSCTVAVGAHGLSPSQSKEVPQKPSSAAELVGQSVMGKCSLSWSCSVHRGHKAGSCWEHHIPSVVRVLNWTALGSCESLPDTSAWGVPLVAWREQLLLPVWSREAETRREAEFGGAQHVAEQNSVLHQNPIHQFVGLGVALGVTSTSASCSTQCPDWGTGV